MKNKQHSSAKREHRAVVALSLLFLAAALVGAAALFIRPPATEAGDPAPAAERMPETGGERQSASGDGRESSAETAPEGSVRRQDCYMILLSGLDDDNGGSDTNILVRFDAGGGTIDLVSLPRDTLLNHTWRSNKLNYAYAKGGTELLRSETENLLGVPVDFCITINLRGFVRFIDKIGGVDFYVPADMDYDDPAQDLHIHFSKGSRHLSGQEAMEVVRWRKNNDGTGYANADIGRIATQQAFLKAVAKKALSLGNIPALAETFFTYVKTDDLTLGNLVWLGNEALRIGMDGLAFHTLPGDGAAWYRGESVYALDPAATLALVNEALNPYTADRTADDLDILVP